MVNSLDPFWNSLGDAPDDGALRRYYQAILASDLLLPTDASEGEAITPHLVDLDGKNHALAFDTETRLAAFFEDGCERAELSGAALLGMLSGAGLGLALNPGMENGQFFLGPDEVAMLAGAGGKPGEKVIEFNRLEDVSPDVLAQILDAVATLAGRAESAVLASTQTGGLVVVVIETDQGIAPNLARLLSLIDTDEPLELVLMNREEFTRSGLAEVGLSLEVPQIEAAKPIGAPGSDPEKPPILKC